MAYNPQVPDNYQLYSNTLSSTGAITGIDTTGYASIVAQISGGWIGNIIFEGSSDNTLWEQIFVLDINEFSMQQIINGDGTYIIKTANQYIRLNVKQLQSGNITAVIVGRTNPSISGADLLSFAMDKNNNTPLYVEETASRKDLSKALIPSDAPTSIYGFAQAINAVVFQTDTTGYQSVIVQCLTVGATITMQMSNDGASWSSLFGYSANATSPTASMASTGFYVFPALGKFVRGILAANAFSNCVVYLRQQPLSASLATAGLPINIQSVGGNSFVNTTGVLATNAVTSFTGRFAVGGLNTIGSTTVPDPILIGGREAPSDGALGGKVRTLLTDTLGRAIVGGQVPSTESGKGISLVGTQDNTLYEGQLMIEILAQILLELKINNQLLSELPTVLRTASDTLPDPSVFRNDATAFAN